jgi:hypothetical protein
VYDDDDDNWETWMAGPEAQMWAERHEAEERARQRTDALLRVIEQESDPISRSRQDAQRLWDAVQAEMRKGPP